MSTIIAPTIDAMCADFKTPEVMENEKSSEDNLDFIVTLLNAPAENEMDDSIISTEENSSSPFLIIQNCQTTPQTIKTTETTTTLEPLDLEHDLEIEVFSNDHNNIENQISTNDTMSSSTQVATTITITEEATTTLVAAITPPLTSSTNRSMKGNTAFTSTLMDNKTTTTTNPQSPRVTLADCLTISQMNKTTTTTTTTYQSQSQVSLPPFLLPRTTLHNDTNTISDTGCVEVEAMEHEGEGMNVMEEEQQQQEQQKGSEVEKYVEETAKERSSEPQKARIVRMVVEDDKERAWQKKMQIEEVEGCDNDAAASAADEDDDADYDDDDDDDDAEDDLTNLAWLTELRNQSITWPSSINPIILDDNLDSTGATAAASCHTLQTNYTHKNSIRLNSNGSQKMANKLGKTLNPANKAQASTNAAAKTNSAQTQVKRPTPAERYQIFMDKVNRDLQEYEASAENYQTDPTEKPPFNYSHIIGMAMLEKGRVTLQQICSWIESKFAFFRVRKKWNNSIRHNLSLHHCFRKINRNKDEKGKGGYWELGVDLKKCDRKRIRHRKSANSSNKNKTKNKTLCSNNNNNNNNSNDINSNTSHNLQTATEATLIAAATAAAAAMEATELSVATTPTTTTTTTTTTTPATLAHLTADLEMQLDVQLPADLVHTEHLLLDDLDVQQNIDISSQQQQQQQQQQQHQHQFHHHHPLHQQQQPMDAQQIAQHEDAFIANVLANYIEADVSHEGTTSLNVDELSNSPNATTTTTAATTMTLTAGASLPQYQLGTVIISTTTDDIAAIDVANALNSFIYNNTHTNNNSNSNSNNNNQNNNEYCQSQSHSQQHEVLYREDEIPACENIIVSSFLTEAMDTHSLSPSAASIPNRPNVIVEPLEPYYSVISAAAAATSLVTAAGSDHCPASSQGDHFRPYIDGIDEAFQYLRSMDHNRSEDLLDNLLDISVSDY